MTNHIRKETNAKQSVTCLQRREFDTKPTFKRNSLSKECASTVLVMLYTHASHDRTFKGIKRVDYWEINGLCHYVISVQRLILHRRHNANNKTKQNHRLL